MFVFSMFVCVCVRVRACVRVRVVCVCLQNRKVHLQNFTKANEALLEALVLA